MADKKQLTADFFLALQFCLAAISGGSQFVRLLTTSQGLNISWLASWLAFLLINLALIVRAHRAQPSRVTLQTVLSYGVWTLVIAANLALLLWKGTAVWDAKDWVTTHGGKSGAAGDPDLDPVAGPSLDRPPGTWSCGPLFYRAAPGNPGL